MTDLLTSPIMVFDVESIGLHGEGFSVGFVVIQQGAEVESARHACPFDTLLNEMNNKDDLLWLRQNIPVMPFDQSGPIGVRESFWSRWMYWKEQGAILAADCLWPVESRFLCDCVDHDRDTRKWNGPYPFLEISSFIWAKGLDPLKTYDREKNELPQHDPLADARQSARILWNAISGN